MQAMGAVRDKVLNGDLEGARLGRFRAMGALSALERLRAANQFAEIQGLVRRRMPAMEG